MYKSLIAIDSQTVPNKNEQTLTLKAAVYVPGKPSAFRVKTSK